MYVAREKAGKLCLFTVEPAYNQVTDEWHGLSFEQIELSPLLFKEVTWENSPVQVELKIVK